MLRSSTIVIFAALAGACSSTPAQSTTDNNVEPPTVDAAAPTPLVIRGGRGRGQGKRDAPWLEQPFRDQLDLRLDDHEVVAIGIGTAIVSTTMGYFVLDHERGVSGLLNPPADLVWIGIGGRADAFFAATKAGVLYRAGTPAAAARGFTRVGKVAGASLWDAAPGIVVAAVGDRVHVSANGASFSRMRSVGKGLTITELFARHDGVVVARTRDRAGKPKVFVTRDRKRWRAADYQPAGLRRNGAWIAGSSDGCVEVLTSDKVHWIRTSEPTRMTPWDINLAHGDTFRLNPPAPHQTATNPAAPAYEAASDANSSLMGCRGEGAKAGVFGALIGTVIETALDPIRETVRPRPPITRTEIDALSDGHCAIDASGACDDQRPPVRMPHALALDRQSGKLRVLSLPPRCRPHQVDAISGLGLLLCKQGASLRAHTLVGDVFVAEHTLPVASITATGVARDGTIGLASCSESGCKLFVRLPVAAGMGGGWREVAIANAIAFRLLGRGRVLAVIEEQADENATDFSLVLSRPSGADRTLATGIHVEGFVEALDVDTDNHVFLTLSSRGKPARKWLIGKDGSLLAAD